MGSFLQVFKELKANRFRTLLSMLGVSVGIFSIVSALSLVDSLQQSLRTGFSAFGSDILFVDREPLEPDLNEDGTFQWWKYASRPQVSWQDYRYLKENGRESYRRIAYVSYGLRSTGVAGDWRLLTGQPLAEGRGFLPQEIEEGSAVVLAGAGTEAKTGEKIWLENKRYEVIGVFEKAGMMTVCPVDIDQVMLVPARSQRGPLVRGSILLAGADRETVHGLMRSARRLTPLQADDFSLNQLSYLLEETEDLFSLAAKLGWLIGLFALVSGGIGIANMLYVSVEERRIQIGICRAIGAKRNTIVRSFLEESVIIALLGATIGISMTASGMTALRMLTNTELPMTLGLKNILTGFLIATINGLLFGVAPARSAARLSPAEAMRK